MARPRKPGRPPRRSSSGAAARDRSRVRVTGADKGATSGGGSSGGSKRPPPKTRAAARLSTTERVSRWIVVRLFRLVWWVGTRSAAVGLVILGGATAYYAMTLPPAAEILDGRDRGSVTLRDRYGDVFAWRGEQYVVTRAETASPHLVNAVIATEDKRFRSHFGLDPRGLARAMAANLQAGRLVQGGSTITQQVAKLVFLDHSRTIERKLKEMPIALAMELRYSKDEILSVYLNRAYLGAGAQGFEAAAQRYFGKSARDVGPAEAAMLAGLLKAPSAYAPTRDIATAQGRADVIIGLMADQGYLTPGEALAARAQPAELFEAAAERTGGAFADWVMEAGPDFLTRATIEDVEIETTFDPHIQRAAEVALVSAFENKVREGSEAQAAIVVMSPDGAVRAMVGGRAGGSGQFNRATQALRQPGSAFKPFVYAAALETGRGPLDIVVDEPVTIDVPGSGPWSPQNYTRDYKGPMTMTEALRQSVNTVAVRLSEEAGRERVRAIARDFGITSPLADGPALALGVSEVTLLELTGAYAGFLNGGRVSLPRGVREIRLKDDPSFVWTGDRGPAIPVLSDQSAGMLVYMLNQVVLDGTGQRALLADRPAAGKTGTTQAARDAWFVGFTGDYVAGVWMGYDDNTSLTGVTGGGLPAEIWRDVMLRVHAGKAPTPLPMLVPGPQVATAAQDREAETIVESVLDALLGLGN